MPDFALLLSWEEMCPALRGLCGWSYLVQFEAFASDEKVILSDLGFQHVGGTREFV